MEEQILNLYNNKFTCKEIATQLSIHRTTVSKILKKLGIQIEKRHNQQKQNLINNKICAICEKNKCKRRNMCTGCYTTLRRFKLKKWMIEYKGKKCSQCQIDDLDMACYDFHHINPDNKSFALTAINSAKISLENIKNELDKCELLCANCHRAKHSNYDNQKLLLYVDKLKIKLLK